MLDDSFGNPEIILVDRDIGAIVTAVIGMCGQRKNSDRLVAMLERERCTQGFVRCRITGCETVVVSEPVEVGSRDGIDEMLRCSPIEFVITRDDVHRRQGIHVIECLNHLLSVPELALERRVEKITAVQNSYVLPGRLKLANYRDDTTEATLRPVFDGAHPVSVIEVYQCQA